MRSDHLLGMCRNSGLCAMLGFLWARPDPNLAWRNVK
jgi:hypothetical protein